MKVYIVYKEYGDYYSFRDVLSVHSSEEKAKEECARLFELNKNSSGYDPYRWEERPVV